MPSAKTRNAIITVVVAVVALVLAVTLSSRDSDSSASSGTKSSSVQSSSVQAKPGATTKAAPSSSAAKSTQQTSTDAPARVLATLAEIDAGRWPDSANAPGTKGGITFRNSEGRLPAVGAGGGRVVYQEWDVNPKKNGQGRDAERIVTGNDGSAWYTLDHYDTFVRIR
ncbi:MULTISPECIES: ribonuclease domain-containing protein [unclassified Rhodococcus (in: high G+C Gram-positive bacteria)]|uniref:ribonuclease domain-containing protein n=1 Tax=unclassified Rhodococcus (in: high G+C Gram-positive bacteria) TaxID=192944 RepID=UPI0024B68FB4|nr:MULTISPECIES: ribonuclease domain-containing protein [unclassified Rhodococcus (in: high G+C Gram-positive bacteria)]MDI9958021.1 ribonuclease domain-containing protein [Rhodococcus sp. IEGM 1237]MDI9963476.1 ribonuclease domain-containing protein [Rhodococcus sp. IEGM 1251]MDV8126219.1 ribonuclease domain-containing protein [Rhodococcus sp. IEGM 1304]